MVVLKKGLLRLRNNIYILLGFPWHKQWHGVIFFQSLNAFLDILFSFDKNGICINTCKFVLLQL